jgi:hypothetical protein
MSELGRYLRYIYFAFLMVITPTIIFGQIVLAHKDVLWDIVGYFIILAFFAINTLIQLSDFKYEDIDEEDESREEDKGSDSP